MTPQQGRPKSSSKGREAHRDVEVSDLAVSISMVSHACRLAGIPKAVPLGDSKRVGKKKSKSGRSRTKVRQAVDRGEASAEERCSRSGHGRRERNRKVPGRGGSGRASEAAQEGKTFHGGCRRAQRKDALLRLRSGLSGGNPRNTLLYKYHSARRLNPCKK